MRYLAAMTLLTVAGCATVAANKPENATEEGTCRSEQLNQFVGQRADAVLGAKMLDVSGARTLRWVAPGMAVTMDFRADRLTVTYDAAYLITQASCG